MGDDLKVNEGRRGNQGSSLKPRLLSQVKLLWNSEGIAIPGSYANDGTQVGGATREFSQASEEAETGPWQGWAHRLLDCALRKVLFLILLFREVYDSPIVPRSEWGGQDWKPRPTHTEASLILAQSTVEEAVCLRG